MKQLYYDEIKPRKYAIFKQQMLSEKDLLSLSIEIKTNEADQLTLISNMISDLANDKPYNKNFDWNIGSTIQHLDSSTVISAFKNVNSPYLTDSIGLAWVFGEFGLKDPEVIKFLHKVIHDGRDSESWWRAAFSLEKLGEGDAITLLKRHLKAEGIRELSYYFENIHDKKSIVGILLRSTNQNLRTDIYPFLKKTFLDNNDKKVLINCAWLIGRYKLVDQGILKKIISVIKKNTDYELVYYTFFAIQELALPSLIPIFREFINNQDELLRKMAIRSISYIDTSENQQLLEELIIQESSPYILPEISKSLYRIKNSFTKDRLVLKQNCNDIENGLIIDDSDKWYADPSIYEIFSYSEDPENICFKVIEATIKEKLKDINNPIDLATGTGRAFRYFVDRLNYKGTFFAIDKSAEMLSYLERVINRNHGYIHDFNLIESTIVNLNLGIKSDFILSSFGFPSKFTNKDLCIKELSVIHKHLSPNGIFMTLGWDESFNDELNHYWFKYIPDNISEFDFEKWRNRRMKEFDSPRNCNLKWLKKGIHVPLQFNNLKESARTMGHLFGRDAAMDIIDNKKIEWSMSHGITLNTKDEIESIIKTYK